MFGATSFNPVKCVYQSTWLAKVLKPVGEMNGQTLSRCWRLYSWYPRGPLVMFNEVLVYPYTASNPLCNSENERSAAANYLISYPSKLNWFWSGRCQKKKKLRPGEDYSVYKSKAAASICNGILFKKILIWQSPFQVWVHYKCEPQARC